MSSVFGSFDVRVDPWEVDYGSETPLVPAALEMAEETDVNVEFPGQEWRPVEPPSMTLPSRIYFVDGVRRLEARLQVRRGVQRCHGAFGSYAVGCVLVSSGAASFAEYEVGRLVVLGDSQRLPQEVSVRPDLVYQTGSIADNEPDGPLRYIQSEMRRVEARLARWLTEQPQTLVVADGPLTFEEQGRGSAVGYVKRMIATYLPVELVAVVAGLPPASRSPLFAIRGSKQGFARYAWYLRLAAPRPSESELHGLARLEVKQELGVDAARQLANVTTQLLPRFAPPRGVDPRSPQNLLPIGALENRLRHELGDQQLLRRWIETVIAKEVAVA